MGLAGFVPYYFFAYLSPLVLFAGTLLDWGYVTADTESAATPTVAHADD
jgi:hypothetical protein